MGQIFFLLFCASNAFVYVLLKYFYFKFHGFSTGEIMSYVNIATLLLILPYGILNPRRMINAFVPNLRIALIAPASFLKVLSVQYISPKGAMVLAFIAPAFVTLFAFRWLKEYDKKNLWKYSMLLVSMCGAIIFIGPEFSGAKFWYSVMLLHVTLKALIHIFIKQLSNDRYAVLFYSQFYYVIFAIFIFIYYKRFDITMFYKYEIWLFALISAICQLCMIVAYKLTTKISLLQNLDYSRPIFSCFFSYLLLGDMMRTNQFLGLGIMILSMIISQYDGINIIIKRIKSMKKLFVS